MSNDIISNDILYVDGKKGKRVKLEQYQDAIARLFPSEVTGEKTLSRTVTFQVTDACNLACTYCYQINKGKRKLKFEDAKKLIDMLLDEDDRIKDYIDPAKSPALIIEFIGGEPFMEIELMDQITDYFKIEAAKRRHPWATRHCISICSNGVLYFEPKVQEFLNKNKFNISFSITIDGNKELHDSCRVFHDGRPSYDIAVAGSQDWMAKGNYMGSKITIAPENITYLYDAITHMIDLDYDEINANVIYEEGWNVDHAKIYYEQLKKIADYWIDNDYTDSKFLALFEEHFFKPKHEEDNDNWCFRAGTMVLTPSGEVPIETLKIGDEVIAADGYAHKVINTMSRIAEDTISIAAPGMFRTYSTKDHPYLVKRFSHIGNKGVYRYGEPEWVKLSDIKSRDKIALYKYNFGNTQIDQHLAYIVGRYIGDGWHSTTGYKICCGYHETNDMEMALSNANIQYSYDDYRTVRQYNIYLNNTELIEIISDAGTCALDKRIPKVAFDWDYISITYLLTGLFDADGSFYEPKNLNKFNTVSETLASNVMMLLKGLGFYPTCYKNNRAGKHIIEGREVNVNDRYEVYYNSDPSKTRFCNYDLEYDLIWSTVGEMREEEPYEVFNLTVNEVHSFIANGAIVHNCGGTGYMLAIDPDGRLYPCIRYMESSLGDDVPAYNIGDVEEGIGQSELTKDRINCLECITRKTQSTDECFNCPIADGCSWCSALNYQEFGTPDSRVTHICIMHKTRALANVYYWNKVYKKQGLNKVFKIWCPDDWALEIIDQYELDMLKELSKPMNENTIIENEIATYFGEGMDR